MSILLFKILIVVVIAHVLWNMYRDAITRQRKRKLYIPKDNTPIKREHRSQHNTKRLAAILDNKQKPQIKRTGFDYALYEQIMAEYDVSDTYQTYQ